MKKFEQYKPLKRICWLPIAHRQIKQETAMMWWGPVAIRGWYDGCIVHWYWPIRRQIMVVLTNKSGGIRRQTVQINNTITSCCYSACWYDTILIGNTFNTQSISLLSRILGEKLFTELVNQNGWLLSACKLILPARLRCEGPNCIQLAGKCLLIFPVIMFNKPSTKRTWGTK